MNNNWLINGGRLLKPVPCCLAGIVNITPDSFFDGNQHFEPEKAIAHGRSLLADGADILDLGAQSTRPGFIKISPEEEWNRLKPVILALQNEVVLSVDSFYYEVLKQALELGVHIINDVSACEDSRIMHLAAEFGAGYVLMHGWQPVEADKNIVDQVLKFFEIKLELLIKAGLKPEQIVLDPGIGFGKSNAQSLVLLQNLEKLHSFGRPLYLAISMKSLFRDLYGLPVEERGELTRLLTVLMAQKGVSYHRLHEIKAAKQALDLWYRLG